MLQSAERAIMESKKKFRPNLFNSYPPVMANPKARSIIHNSRERNEYIAEYRVYKPIYMSVYKFAQIKQDLYSTHQTAVVDKMFLDFDPDDGDPYMEMMRAHSFFMNKNNT